MVYLALFGSGYVLLLAYTRGIILLIISAICAAGLYANLAHGGWEESDTEKLAHSTPMPLHH
jgi:hypothetical protein